MTSEGFTQCALRKSQSSPSLGALCVSTGAALHELVNLEIRIQPQSLFELF
jgi:hypothetical protein